MTILTSYSAPHFSQPVTPKQFIELTAFSAEPVIQMPVKALGAQTRVMKDFSRHPLLDFTGVSLEEMRKLLPATLLKPGGPNAPEYCAKALRPLRSFQHSFPSLLVFLIFFIFLIP